jgi:hypothetical protein
MVTDIEQPLTERNVIHLAHLLPTQAQDGELPLVETCHEVVPLPLYAHPPPLHPCAQWADPSSGRTRGRLRDGGGQARWLTCSGLTQPTLRPRRAHQHPRHAPQPSWAPRRLLAPARRDNTPRGFAQPAAPCHLAVGLVGRDALCVAQVTSRPGGAQHHPPFGG